MACHTNDSELKQGFTKRRFSPNILLKLTGDLWQ
jgi:hypothetical protein